MERRIGGREIKRGKEKLEDEKKKITKEKKVGNHLFLRNDYHYYALTLPLSPDSIMTHNYLDPHHHTHWFHLRDELGSQMLVTSLALLVWFGAP